MGKHYYPEVLHWAHIVQKWYCHKLNNVISVIHCIKITLNHDKSCLACHGDSSPAPTMHHDSVNSAISKSLSSPPNFHPAIHLSKTKPQSVTELDVSPLRFYWWCCWRQWMWAKQWSAASFGFLAGCRFPYCLVYRPCLVCSTFGLSSANSS